MATRQKRDQAEDGQEQAQQEEQPVAVEAEKPRGVLRNLRLLDEYPHPGRVLGYDFVHGETKTFYCKWNERELAHAASLGIVEV